MFTSASFMKHRRCFWKILSISILNNIWGCSPLAAQVVEHEQAEQFWINPGKTESLVDCDWFTRYWLIIFDSRKYFWYNLDYIYIIYNSCG